jgi:SAM-dependent methyltransferase
MDVEMSSAPPEGGVRATKTPPPPPPESLSKSPPATAKKPPPPPPGKEAEDQARRKRVRQWWERFFSDDYLMSVLPPTEEQVARQVDFIEASLSLPQGGTVLDVGCGLGLHAIELTRRGYLVVGLDLSLTMITRAAEEAQHGNLKINFLHADIREIEFEGTFDGVICMGTTFGFFDDEANRDVLRRLFAALKPGGRLLLDVVNRDYVIESQPNLIWFQGDECVCMEESDFNYFSSRLVVKRTMMREDGQQSQAEYSIRLYSLHELGQVMQQTGFRVIEVSGQEATRGVFFGAHSSRILMLGERRIPGRPSVAMPPERTSGEIPKPPPKPD